MNNGWKWHNSLGEAIEAFRASLGGLLLTARDLVLCNSDGQVMIANGDARSCHVEQFVSSHADADIFVSQWSDECVTVEAKKPGGEWDASLAGHHATTWSEAIAGVKALRAHAEDDDPGDPDGWAGCRFRAVVGAKETEIAI